MHKRFAFLAVAALALAPSASFGQAATTTGAATGAVTGAVVGGPVGAVVGGMAGASVGAAAEPRVQARGQAAYAARSCWRETDKDRGFGYWGACPAPRR
jgi:hypothetical protein